MTIRTRRSAALFLAGCLGITWGLSPQDVQAQAFGNRNMGGSLSGGTRNAFGGGGGGAFGQSGGAIGGTPGQRLDNLDSSGQITGNERFLRDNRTTGQFVGSDSADSGFVGALSGGATGGAAGLGGFGGQRGLGGAGGMSGSGGLGGFGGQGMLGGMGGRNTGGRNAGRFGNAMGGMNRNRQINVRTRMTIGFAVPERLPVIERQERIGKVLNSGRIVVTRGDLTIEIDQGTATLRGRVATDADREVALQLAKLEPGVEAVRDELVVASRDDE